MRRETKLNHSASAVGGLRPEVVHAIVTGNTPMLRALDEKPYKAAALAA